MVILDLLLDENGKVLDARVHQSAGDAFDSAALTAAKQFTFSPAEIDNEPAPIRIQYRYGFHREPASPQTSAIRGTIRDRATGSGLSNVTVTLDTGDRVVTDADGRYTFTTIKPGPYPWRNHRNAWRPAHIHFSVFGTAFTQRLVTQMYFPGDPLFPLDPIYNSVVDPAARERMVATYDHDLTEPETFMGYRWDIVLTGPHRTLLEEAEDG